MQALNKLSRALRKRPGDFFFAGTKDKRAESVQQIVAKNTSKVELANVTKNPSWNFDEINFSNIKYTEKCLKVGDLKGNRFTIALRFPDKVEIEKIKDNLEKVRASGFVNYFGLQRFGSKSLVY